MPHLVYLTAGAAGMYCGSCLHDNALARAIQADGRWDVTLVPTYTPIRTDEVDVSVDQVFFGGINVYLQQKLPWLRILPAFLDRWLDQPWLIRRLTAKAADTPPEFLGQLAVSMLRGREGNQRKEVFRLIRWLKQVKPDAIILTNVLIGGCVADLQRELGVPVIGTLQGDDAFLDSLPDPFRQQATALAGQVALRCDGILVHSNAYADYMANYLNVPRERMHRTVLGIDTSPWSVLPPRVEPAAGSGPTLGYLARLAPEKGLHRLIDAFIYLKQQPGFQGLRLRVAGWLGQHRRTWFEGQWQRIQDAGFGAFASYEAELDRTGKLAFLSDVDLLCVPTDHLEPKGLFALEALAAGVPVVVPARGAFPELLASTGGGRLCLPANGIPELPAGMVLSQPLLPLAETLAELLSQPELCRQLGAEGQAAVLQRHNASCMAEQTIEVLERIIADRRSA